MKITRKYLKKIIKEAIRDEMGWASDRQNQKAVLKRGRKSYPKETVISRLNKLAKQQIYQGDRVSFGEHAAEVSDTGKGIEITPENPESVKALVNMFKSARLSASIVGDSILIGYSSAT
jgi:hypothetical protein